MPVHDKKAATLAAIFLGLAASAHARSTVEDAPAGLLTAAALSVPLVSAPVRVDARLDEAMWQNALVLELPFEIDPGENTPAPVRTECLLAYDEDKLYIGFRAHDPEPHRIRAHYTDRDGCFRDDFVGIMLDTFNDERRAFEFFVNPLGVQMDLARNEVGSGDQEDSNWDALWESAGRITPEGYQVEMAIPFSSLRFPAGGQSLTWGIVPFRAWPRTDRHQLTTFENDRNRNCFICQAPKMNGFHGIAPGRNLEITPTMTSRRTDEREDLETGPLATGAVDADPGVSLAWGMTPNLALNATLNPDFSQIEADVAQLAVNRQFALFYAEKRPFFLEGRDFFETPLRVVHTRSIADPDFGLKITGKAGPNALGAFIARDAVTNVLIPGSQGSDFAEADGKVWDAVLRYRRDVGSSSTLGALATARAGDDYDNLVAGVDGLLRLGKVDSVRFQALGTSTRYPRALAEEYEQRTDRFHGFGGQLMYARDGRDWSWWGGYTQKTRGFRSDLGFVSQADVRGPFLGFQRTVWPAERTWYTRLSYGLEADHADDQDGNLVNQYAEVTFRWSGPYQAFFQGGVGPARERHEGAIHELFNGWTFFNIRPTGAFTSSLETRFGKVVDYENSRPASVLNLTPGLTWDPGRHLRLQLDHTFERLNARHDRVYTANLTQLKAIYQFDTRMFVRAIVQYNNLERNVLNYTDEVEARDHALFSQLLFSYKLSPQTLFHIGYSDNREGLERVSLTQKDRTFFVKISYAWLP